MSGFWSKVAMAGVVCLAATAAAAPQVSIKAHTRIQIDRVSRSEGGIRVSGRLVDSISGAGVPDRDVELRFGPSAVTVSSAHDGSFDAEFDLPADTYSLDARFPGDPFYAASQHGGQRFDVAKTGVTLDIRGAADVQPDDATLDGQIDVVLDWADSATSGNLDIDIEVVDATGSAEPKRVAVVHAVDGVGTFSIPRAKLGRSGDKRIHASFAGNEAFNPAEAEARFRLMAATRIVDVGQPQGPVKYEGKIKITGRLVEKDGPPVEGATIHMRAGSQRVASTLTDRNGRFTLRVAAKEFPPGTVAFTVEYLSTTSWRRGTEIPSIAVTIAQPRPVPVGYTVLAFVVAAGALAAYLLVRTRPWVAWAEALRLRRRRRGTAPEAVVNGAGDAPPATGLKPAKAGLMSTLRRPADFGFSGKVRDVLTGAPLAGAQVEMIPEKGAAEATVLVLQTDEHGGFAVDRLAPGLWRARVAARGYMTEGFHVTIPHRGELRGVRIDLLPVRERVFAIYRGVAQALLPKPELWGVWTPREIFNHVRRRRPAGALGALTDFVEETYFSPRVPEEAIVPSAEASAAAARQELAPGR